MVVVNDPYGGFGPLFLDNDASSAILNIAERGRLESALAEIIEAGEETLTKKHIITALESQLGKRFIKKYAEGMVTYSNGRQVGMNTWAQMYADTFSINTMRQAQMDFSLANGMEIGKIFVNATACAVCVPWDGQLISLTGAHSSLTSLSAVKATGWGHPSCQCIIVGQTPEQIQEQLG